MTTVAHLAADVIRALDQALHQMRVLPVPNYSATDYVCICSCDFEHIPVTTEAEARAQVAAGCPIQILDEQSAQRRARRIAAQEAA